MALTRMVTLGLILLATSILGACGPSHPCEDWPTCAQAPQMTFPRELP